MLMQEHPVPVTGEMLLVVIPSCTSAWRLDPSAILHQDLHPGDAGCHWQGQVDTTDASDGLWYS